MKLVGLAFLVGCAYPALAAPAWEHTCEQLRAVAETYKKWGITFDLQADKTFQGKAGPLPSYLKTTAQLESGDQLNDTLHLNMEAGLGRKEGLAFSLNGDFKADPSGKVVSGAGTMHIKGNGVGGKFTISRSEGLKLETGLEETFYSLGVRFGEKDKGPLALGLKLGPLTVNVDLFKWGQRCHDVLPKMVGGVLIQVDLPALASALNEAPPPEEFRLRDVTVVSLRRLLEQPGPLPLSTLSGLACDATHGDVLLLGRSEAGVPSIPLATLVTVLRSSWKDDLSPYVSLDPDPADRSLMKARYGGLSAGLEKSPLVGTMLKADYGMKQVVNGDIPVEGMLTLDQQMAATPRLPHYVLARFWLAPRPPEWGDIGALRGPAGAVYTFDSEPTLRTEIDEGLSDKSLDLDVIHRRTAACFTRLYPEIEASHPELELTSIRQIFQLATLAALLRKEPPGPACLEVLDRVCALPLESAAVPVAYLASQKRIQQPNGDAYLVWGGVDTRADLKEVQVRADNSLADLFDQLQAGQWSGVTLKVPYAFAPVIADAQQVAASELVRPQLENVSVLLGMGRGQEALSQLERVLAVAPQLVSAHLLRMEALHLVGKYELMQAEGEITVQLAPDNARSWYLRSVASKELEHFGQALDDAERSIRLQPTGQAYLIRSEARCAAADGRGALDDANLAMDLNPSLTRGLLLRARARLLLQDLAGAYSDVTTYISRQPREVSGYRMRALIGEAMEKYPEAVADWHRVVDLEPVAANVVDLVKASIKAGDYVGAVHFSDWILEVQPKTGWAWQLRGMAWQAGGHWKEALADFRKATQLAPNLTQSIQPRIDECSKHLR